MSPEGILLAYGLLCAERFIAVSDRQNGTVVLSDYEGRVLARFEGLASPGGLACADDKLYVITQAGVERIDTATKEREGIVLPLPLPNAIACREEELVAAYADRVAYYKTDALTLCASVETGRETSAMAPLSDQLWCIAASSRALYRIENGICREAEDVPLAFPVAIATGKYGDGCGGGRLFVVDGGAVKVYNPDDGHTMVLMEGLRNPGAIDKKGCSLYVADDDGVTRFDLSKMKGMKFL